MCISLMIIWRLIPDKTRKKQTHQNFTVKFRCLAKIIIFLIMRIFLIFYFIN